MALDHRIQELLLDGPKSVTDLFRALGPVGSAGDWSLEHLQQRLFDLVKRDRVTCRAGGLWALQRGGVAWIPSQRAVAAEVFG